MRSVANGRSGTARSTLRIRPANPSRQSAGSKRTPIANSNPSMACAGLTCCGTRRHPGDLQFLMLYPVSIFDGENQHRDSATMPLIGGRDLRSSVAELRVATRDLEAERANG